MSLLLSKIRRVYRSITRENKGTAGGGGGAERGRGERRDRGRSDKGEHDEKGATARWHERRLKRESERDCEER